MIEVMFRFGGDSILVRVEGTKVWFGNTSFGAVMSDISGLRLSKEGVIKEFPDLKDNSEWKDEAIKRFKEKIKSLHTEDQRVDYIIKDLKRFGYTPQFKMKKGHRKQIIR